MRQGHFHSLRAATALALAAFALAACTSTNWNPFASPDTPPPPAAGPGPEIPASIRAEEVVGRWGYASYHNEADRPRTETAARGQCNQPVVINRGPGGGVMMYLADDPQLQELRLRGGPGGKNYVGPQGESAGGPKDREFVSFDGRLMILRWLDPEISGRYGTGVYVRCAAPGTPTARRKGT
jgi:hypothetical protein